MFATNTHTGDMRLHALNVSGLIQKRTIFLLSGLHMNVNSQYCFILLMARGAVGDGCANIVDLARAVLVSSKCIYHLHGAVHQVFGGLTFQGLIQGPHKLSITRDKAVLKVHHDSCRKLTASGCGKVVMASIFDTVHEAMKFLHKVLCFWLNGIHRNLNGAKGMITAILGRSSR